MSKIVTVTARTDDLGRSDRFGGSSLEGDIVANGTCSFCSRDVGFRQIGTYEESGEIGHAVAVRCDNCHSIMTVSYSDGEASLYPAPKIKGVNEILEAIDQYYQEALDCSSTQAPHGAVTLFRKTIHAIAIHYDIAEVDESMGIYEMIDELHEYGQINEKLRKSLLAVKDLGNDGAHINENEPDMDQASATKDLIDAVLSATVIADQRMEYARENHPNQFAVDSEDE